MVDGVKAKQQQSKRSLSDDADRPKQVLLHPPLDLPLTLPLGDASHIEGPNLNLRRRQHVERGVPVGRGVSSAKHLMALQHAPEPTTERVGVQRAAESKNGAVVVEGIAR